MKTIFTKKMMLAAIMMVIGAVNLMADNGDTFTTKTVEGVKMTFTITSESSKECFAIISHQVHSSNHHHDGG